MLSGVIAISQPFPISFLFNWLWPHVPISTSLDNVTSALKPPYFISLNFPQKMSAFLSSPDIFLNYLTRFAGDFGLTTEIGLTTLDLGDAYLATIASKVSFRILLVLSPPSILISSSNAHVPVSVRMLIGFPTDDS